MASDSSAKIESAPAPSPSEQIRPGLLTLPPELRNDIYQLVLIHHEGGGVISPTQKKQSKDQGSAHVHSLVLKGRCRMHLLRGRPYLMTGSPLVMRSEKLEYYERMEDIRLALPKQEQDHLCYIDCLRQPALTKVSKQVRSETLPVFYGMNEFHFEMGNFIKSSIAQSPVGLWRALDRDSLSLIRKLNVMGLGVFDHRNEGIMVQYRKTVSDADGESQITKARSEFGDLKQVQRYQGQ